MLKRVVEHGEVEFAFKLAQTSFEHPHATGILQILGDKRVYSTEPSKTLGGQVDQEGALAAAHIENGVSGLHSCRPEPCWQVIRPSDASWERALNEARFSPQNES